jgi:hypothetical protein
MQHYRDSKVLDNLLFPLILLMILGVVLVLIYFIVTSFLNSPYLQGPPII